MAVLMLGALAGAAAGAPPGEQGDGGDSGQASGFIVVLDSGDPEEVAAEHSRRHDAEVSHVYTTVLRGYAAQMSEQAAERVARDDRVAYVNRDRPVQALHHECGHDGGPPGSGEPDCSDPDPGDVSGTVSDNDTGDAIEGATVVLENTDWSDTTASDGSYLIESVDGGDYIATADADGYDPVSEEITVDGDVEVNFELPPASSDDSGDQEVPWGIDRVDAPQAHNDYTGASVDVYVLDTGIDVDHGDLDVEGGYAVEECKGGGCLKDYDDDHGHGTHVAGTAAAIDNTEDVLGMAPDARLWAVKVLDKRGSGSWSGVIDGIDWVAGQGGHPSVANMSLGGSGSKDGTCDANGYHPDPDDPDSLHEAICNATNEGVVFSVAAGNDGADAENSAPAAYDDTVVTVSATEEGDDWPYWSNWGDNAADWTGNDSAPVALAAPGADILSTRLGGGTTTKSGTSMATPHVAGAAALFLEANSSTAADYSAFFDTREGLLQSDESTEGFSNSSGNPHEEDFLDAEALVAN